MFIVKMAFDNLRYNRKKTILEIFLIAVAVCSLLLYKGYVEYAIRGQAMGFIEGSGNLQVATGAYWNNDSDEKKLLEKEDIEIVRSFLSKQQGIDLLEAVFEFSGLIGTDKKSTIFWGAGYDNPQRIGATTGLPVFPDENALVIGYLLADFLNVSPDEKDFVNVMSSVDESGLSVASFDVSGTLDTGQPQNDAGIVIASRATILDFFGMEETASYVQVFLTDDALLEETESALQDFIVSENLNLSMKNWKELNPFWEQLNDMAIIQFFFISIILGILIFVSLSQSLSAAFQERLPEFGTMEAIGLKKQAIMGLLFTEVLLLYLFGFSLGFLFAHVANYITGVLEITMIPPGYSQGYALEFYLILTDSFFIGLFILVTCMVSLFFPLKQVKKNTARHLMSSLGIVIFCLLVAQPAFTQSTTANGSALLEDFSTIHTAYIQEGKTFLTELQTIQYDESNNKVSDDIAYGLFTEAEKMVRIENETGPQYFLSTAQGYWTFNSKLRSSLKISGSFKTEEVEIQDILQIDLLTEYKIVEDIDDTQILLERSSTKMAYPFIRLSKLNDAEYELIYMDRQKTPIRKIIYNAGTVDGFYMFSSLNITNLIFSKGYSVWQTIGIEEVSVPPIFFLHSQMAQLANRIEIFIK